MAGARSREESLTPSSSLAQRKYDVFMSFRGEDTRKNFSNHLFSALIDHGFSTCSYGDELERKADTGIELLKAIEESRISVILFSRNYATSRWCLDELVKIMECKNSSIFKQIVVPVFYDVDPSDVRAQRGSFAKAFADHEKRFRGCEMEGKIRMWRSALTEASNLSGWALTAMENRHESKFIKMIVEDISKKLNIQHSNVAGYPISARSREESLNPSSSLPPRKYDVFMSFRGEDTGKNFSNRLFSALIDHGFSTCSYGNELERKADTGIELLKAIEESRISVIVFSRTYATSRWCLDELVKIMECKNSTIFKQIVVPVFYDVEPSDIRKQRGSFAKAFADDEERFKGCGMEGKIRMWRSALTEASNLSGWPLPAMANGHDSKFIEMIVEDISNKLNIQRSNVAGYPIGIESRVQDVIMLLRLGSDDVRMVGILGLGGIGKTTIAKAMYNLIHHNFEGSSFLANIREISKQSNGRVDLQEKLLSDILKNKIQNIRNVFEGIEIIKRRLWCKKVLVVLDDVDGLNQIEALAIRRDWLCLGSRIIVTTRDESILKFLKVDDIYRPNVLNYDESLQLLRCHAFRKGHRIEDYAEPMREIQSYAGGLPLVLEVLASFLFDKSMPDWKSALFNLKAIPHVDIHETLRISFDSLDVEEKDLFLDIACFFVGMDKYYTIRILEGCGFFSEIGIGILSRRSLVGIDESNRLTMHDLLRDMGREIVRGEFPVWPGRRSRLWSYKDVLDVLTNNAGTEAVEGLSLNLPKSNDIRVDAQAFAKMNRLRLLQLNYVRLNGSYEHLSKRLRWLCWFGFPLKSIPSDLFMEKVVAIDMRYSSLRKVWTGRKIFSKLTFLNLSHSYDLTETPDFSGCTSLEMLWLNDCIRLLEFHQSIECLEKLVLLDLRNCKNLRKLPLGIWNLKSLQNLDLFGCSKLEKFPGFKESPLKSWFSSFLSRSSLLRNINFVRDSQASIQGLISIKKLTLANCNLSYVPDELGRLFSLEWLDLEKNDFCTLPASISRLSQLKGLSLSFCTRLQSLPELPVNLKLVDASDCPSLERISVGSHFQKSPFLNFSDCYKLLEVIFACNFNKTLLLNQELSAASEFSILFTGGEIPYYFNYKNAGSVLSLAVPDRKIRGWTLCVVITACIDKMVKVSDSNFTYRLNYKVENKTKGFEWCNSPSYARSSHYCQDQLWIHCAPEHYHELQMEAGDVVEYSVFIDDMGALDEEKYSEIRNQTEANQGVDCLEFRNPHQFQVKKCGVNLIYMDDEKDYSSNDLANIQYASTSNRNVILNKDVSADQAVIDNEIMATEGGIRSIEPTQQSAPSTHKRGRPSCIEKGSVVDIESDEQSTRRRTEGSD